MNRRFTRCWEEVKRDALYLFCGSWAPIVFDGIRRSPPLWGRHTRDPTTTFKDRERRTTTKDDDENENVGEHQQGAKYVRTLLTTRSGCRRKIPKDAPIGGSSEPSLSISVTGRADAGQRRMGTGRCDPGKPVLAGKRLIVLTSFGQSFSPEELEKAGIEAYLMKPVKQSRLFDRMANALDKAMVEAPCLLTGSKP